MLAGRMACVIAMMMYRGKFLNVLFDSFSKGPSGFPYVTTLEPVYGPTFG